MINDFEALARVVCFANGKGGAGKTSTAVNVAGLCAAAGHKTLLIDLDPQANAGHDLGYGWGQESDDGQHIVNTLMQSGGRLAPVLESVRENLDVIPAGRSLDDLEDVIAGRSRRGENTDELLAKALAPLAATYDLVIIDTPPTRPVLLRLALAASKWVVVPTRADRSSIEGLRVLAEQLVNVRKINPQVAILGAVLFDVSSSASAIRRRAVEDITDVLGTVATPFEPIIRHSEQVATQARESGLLVHEIAEQVEDAEPFWIALKEGRQPRRMPGTAPALADDYVLLTQEILNRIATHEAEQAQAS